MAYVDGFVIPIPKKNLKSYRAMAELASKVWKKYGALDYKECVADDLKSKWGTSFTKLTKLKRGETVIFAYILFKSRKHRDSVNAKVMKDPLMNDPDMAKNMPFEIKRMSYGGFDVIVD